MPMTDVGFFAFLIATFQDVLRQAADLAYPWVCTMLGILLVLELGRVMTGVAMDKDHARAAYLGYAIRFIVLCLVIPRWEYVFTTLTTLGVDIGLHIGGNRIPKAQFLNPGAYLQRGVQIGSILYEQWNNSQISNAFQIALSPIVTAGYFIAWVLFLLAFFVIALIIFMKQIEMAFALPTLLLLLPFLAFGKTGWIGQGVITYVVKLAYTFCMLALIASVIYPVLEQITLQPPDVRQAWMIVFAAGSLLTCFIAGPMLARNIMSGVFTLGAGSQANAALLGLQTLTLAKSTVQEMTRHIVNVAGGVLHEASGGVVLHPTVPAPPTAGVVTQSLREGARHLHG